MLTALALRAMDSGPALRETSIPQAWRTASKAWSAVNEAVWVGYPL